LCPTEYSSRENHSKLRSSFTKGSVFSCSTSYVLSSPDAEFAFLSACHTAELTDESIADEVLHLAAAMQFCGFRSVVGTMWAIADMDGRDLARESYQSVFSDNGRQGIPYYERTAEALRDAVQNLRRKGGMTLERWVNFVHYGA